MYKSFSINIRQFKRSRQNRLRFRSNQRRIWSVRFQLKTRLNKPKTNSKKVISQLTLLDPKTRIAFFLNELTAVATAAKAV